MILLLLILLPLLLSALSAWRVNAPWVTALLFALAAVPALLLGFGWVDCGAVSFGDLLLELELGLDAQRQVLLALAAVLWLTGGLFAAGYLSGQQRVAEFRFCFLFSMAGNLGLIVAQDAASFYTLFALMTFAAYGLVINSRSREALRAGRIYLIMAILGELLLIFAIYAAVSISGSIKLAEMAQAVWSSDQRHWVYALAIAGFGVKVGMIPLYFWLPLAHPVAPTPASAILSGSMLKAGLLGWLHFSPIAHGGATEWLLPLAALGLVAALGAVVIGLFQTDAKTNLAYSSISQMGLLTLFFALCHSAGAPLEWMLPGLAIYAWNHGIAKGVLFLGVGMTLASSKRSRPWVLLGLAFAALSIAGAPLTGGALTKAALKDAGAVASGGLLEILPALLFLSSLLTTLLLGRFILLCTKKPLATEPKSGAGWQALSWSLLLAVLAVGTAGWFRVLLPEVSLGFDAAKWLAAASPIMVGIVVLFIAVSLLKRNPIRYPKPLIPPGDAIVLFEHGWAQLRRVWTFHLWPILTRRRLDPEKTLYRLLGIEKNARLADIGERQLGHWNSVGIAFFFVLLALVFSLS
jgi:formate hydrogenlyase subunit 3/multisubunit Na+/H+ antiporter MnhD subunit